MRRISRLVKRILSSESYYPELKRKNNILILFEQIREFILHGTTNPYYFVYGLDVHYNNKEYLNYNDFMVRRDLLNQNKPYNYICLLRDKVLFSHICKLYGIPTVENIGEINSISELESILNSTPKIFIKPKDSMCGNGAILLDTSIMTKDIYTDYMSKIEVFLKKESCLVQSLLINHKDINVIYPHSINTIRVVTINPNYSDNVDDVIVLGSLLRVGAKGSVVDNWAKGGLVVGINNNGRLMKYGFYKPGYGTKTEIHPDSNFKFEGHIIPYYEKIISLCKLFHSKLYKIHSIGWDVAVTEDGPIFIEGNDDWELGFIQVCFGGIKKEFDNLFK